MEMVTIGVDEVNFSPSICGDTVVCACMIPSTAKVPRGWMKDSKQTTLRQRLRAFNWLQWNSLYVVEIATVNHIAAFGVHRARNIAMYRAMTGLVGLSNLSTKKLTRYEIVVDGPPIKDLTELWKLAPAENADLTFVVNGDEKVKVVSAASIIAKVYVDATFEGWEVYWPGFGMNRDHGSPSKAHEAHLRKWGPSPIHRQKGYAEEWWREILSGEGG